MNFLSGLIIASLLLMQSTIGAGRGTGAAAATASAGTPPTMTYRWAAYSTANTCGTTGTVSCTTTGQTVYSLDDLADGLVATQTSAGNQPTYLLSAVNSKPGLTFNGSSSYMTPDTGFTPIEFTFYAVQSYTELSGNNGILGADQGGAIEWRLAASGQQQLLYEGEALLATSTTTYTAGTPYTIVATLNTGNGAYTFGHCSAGTLVADGSGTASSTGTPGAPTTELGGAVAVGDYFYGWLAEVGVLNGSTSTAGICSWSLSEYGI